MDTILHKGKQVTMAKVVLEVRYRDKKGQWQGSHSFGLNEIPKAILALQKAFEYPITPIDPREESPAAPSRVPNTH